MKFTLSANMYYVLFLESDRSHDEARYWLPDNYVTLKLKKFQPRLL